MAPANDTPSAAELRAAFQRSGLWRYGWSYHRAITCPPVFSALTADARAARKHPPAPQQLGLELLAQ